MTDKVDVNQLKSNPTRWQQIKQLAYADNLPEIAKLAGLPDCSPGNNYSEANRVRMCAIAEDL